MLQLTDEQKKFIEKYPGIGVLYQSNEPASLADELQKLYNNRHVLHSCREASLSVASRRLNWETEFQKLSEVIDDTLGIEKNQFKRTPVAY